MKVAKWGNSLAVRLPRRVVEALELREGDEVTLHAAGPAEIEVEKTPDRAEWLERMRKFQGRLPADFKFKRGDAVRRGY